QHEDVARLGRHWVELRPNLEGEQHVVVQLAIDDHAAVGEFRRGQDVRQVAVGVLGDKLAGATAKLVPGLVGRFTPDVRRGDDGGEGQNSPDGLEAVVHEHYADSRSEMN